MIGRPRLSGDTAVKNQLFVKYRNSADKRGHAFNLSKEEFLELIIQNCFYCGIPPAGFVKYRYGETLYYTGIDRVDSNIGYETINCVPCCPTCNLAKRKRSKAEFIAWIKRAYKHVSEQGL